MTKKKYRVLRRFQGRQPGDVVELELSDEQERRYLERGSIEQAAAKTSDETAKKEG